MSGGKVMIKSQISCVGYDLLGDFGKDGLRYAWKYKDRAFLVESAAFVRKSKLEDVPNVSGYTSSVSAGCILKPIGLACRFCRTGSMIPFAGALTAYDIAKQNVFMVLTDMYCADHPDLNKNAREFAYMGQGEPGYSYVQVREAIKITDKVMNELGQEVFRHIVATSGIPEMISAYKDDMRNHTFKNRVTMHYSLHATRNREFIMPIDTLYSYKQVLAEVNEIIDITGEKPCIGIMLFKNFVPRGKTNAYSNDIDQARVIANELDPEKVRISLCEVNSSVDTGTSEAWNYDESHLIKKVFEDRGFEVKLFSSFGREKNAACGTLGGAVPDHSCGNKWEKLEKYAEELINKHIYI